MSNSEAVRKRQSQPTVSIVLIEFAETTIPAKGLWGPFLRVVGQPIEGSFLTV